MKSIAVAVLLLGVICAYATTEVVSDEDHAVTDFEENFETLWVQGETEARFETYLDEVINGQEDFPIIVAPMAIDTDQVQELKAAILEECPMVTKTVFHQEPWKYTLCER